MQDSLFPDGPLHLPLSGADVLYYPNFLTKETADTYFDIIYKDTPWQQDDIKVFGKVHPQPRLTSLYGDNELAYSYSNITMHPEVFTFALSEIKKSVEHICQTTFTTCLLNLYRNGKDSNGWHSDDEKELGKNPIIASVSLGADRVFKFRAKKVHSETHKMLLEHGSLLLMKGETQHNWQHQLPKTAKLIGPRINLTFRVVLG